MRGLHYLFYSIGFNISSLNFSKAFFFFFFFFLNKNQLKSPASALGLVNPKSLIKDDNVIFVCAPYL